MESQPYPDRREAVFREAFKAAEEFWFRRLTRANIRSRLMSVHARTLADSIAWFHAAHCRVLRTEPGWFNGRTFMLEDFCPKAGLQLKAPITSWLYSG